MEQAGAGADILDVNVGLPEIDERETKIVNNKGCAERVRSASASIPPVPDVLEAGLRVYNGKPIVNSVNRNRRCWTVCFHLQKYGAAVVGLTLDENGIPALAGSGLRCAKSWLRPKPQAPREDVYIDCLTLTATPAGSGAGNSESQSAW